MPMEISLNPLSRNISIDPRTRSFIRAKPAKATDSKPSYTASSTTSSRKSGKKGVHFAIDVPDKRDGEQWVLTPHPDYTPYWYRDDDRKTPRRPGKPSPALYQLNRNSQPAYGRPLTRLTYPAQLQRRQSNPRNLGLPGLSSQSYPPYERGRAPISSYGSTLRTRSASGTDSTRYSSLSRRRSQTTVTEIHHGVRPRSRSRSRPVTRPQNRSRSQHRAHPPANTTIKHTYIIQNRPREPRTRTRSRERTRPVTRPRSRERTRYYDEEEDRVSTPLTAFREGRTYTPVTAVRVGRTYTPLQGRRRDSYYV